MNYDPIMLVYQFTKGTCTLLKKTQLAGKTLLGVGWRILGSSSSLQLFGKRLQLFTNDLANCFF